MLTMNATMNAWRAAGLTLGMTVMGTAGLGLAACEIDHRGGSANVGGGGGGTGGMNAGGGGEGGLGGVGGQGGVGGMGGAGPLIPGSQYAPAPLRPAGMEILPPTWAYFLSQAGETPSGRMSTGHELCYTSGPADEIDEDAECPNSVLLSGLFHVLDPLTPNATYRWKVRARFDSGHYSEWSAVRVFATDDSLVVRLRLNGNATDTSTAGNDGTVQNGAGFGSGIEGQALQCDGVNDYVDLGGGLTLPGPLTASAWIYGNGISTSADSGILNQGTLNYALTYHTDGRVYFYIGDGGNNLSAPVGADGWHHVLGTFDGTTSSGGMRFYVDGLPSGTKASSLATTGATGSLWIGRYDTSYFDGGIDNVTLYNGELSDAAVLNEFCATQAAGGTDPMPAVCLP